ncbi:PAQR family membrane homeostasis protein TrhA [Mycolicibacterium thermoresistibile]|jgi:hemolysin III|uniref:Hemolysin III family channel protein n=2 Tax=Mycolicibacterium thermoresistibile TaxID=1797 RepID=G7CC83_MYCT3|nr:hemolysin III family protein [Mycolicibacterium thermoresistibile]EHI14346.1 hemolysin III family channel protein [Mycolicibacterium thermoresistibile ATCC 19527]MCV7189511.1 hemolysin III family protein [Mycolicibacterium thermoresistibile]GAT14498.1 hemolysin III family channel protein [Mycolicibacterium thermoresistibile]SNW19729.1 hemolysin III family channel protein [Mycolicibacterium thermoresistibile]
MTTRLDNTSDFEDPSAREHAEDFPEAVVDRVAHAIGKPRARGWIHVYAAVISAIAGATLVSVSWAVDSTRAGIATLIYTITSVAMFTVSGVYHRYSWRSETARTWMMRADHSMIFIFIAGSYTPFGMLALPEGSGNVLLAIVWGGALAGVLLKMFWPSAPRWVGVPLYLLLGWVAAWFIGPIANGAGLPAVVLLIVGGVLYSVGGVLYALKWPDPWPETFGYHEFFHACTAVAALCHYIAMWFAVF